MKRFLIIAAISVVATVSLVSALEWGKQGQSTASSPATIATKANSASPTISDAALTSPTLTSPKMILPLTSGIGQAYGSLCYQYTVNGKMYKADQANPISSTGLVALPMANYSANINSARYMTFGVFSSAATFQTYSGSNLLSSGFQTGRPYYVGTNGIMQKSMPQSGIVRVIGLAISKTKLWFAPWSGSTSK